jgi:hypothetical protein
MDRLSEALETLSTEDLAHIRSIVGVPGSSGKQAVLRALSSYSGIDRLLSDMSGEELSLLSQLWKSKTGLTYSELSRELSIDADDIERIALSLNTKLVVYILKNRKHLNNRLDKVYIQEPVEGAISFVSDAEISERARVVLEVMSKPSPKNVLEIPRKILPLVDVLIDEGGTSRYAACVERFDQNDLDAMISEGIEKEIITLGHVQTKPFVTLLMIHPHAIPSLKTRKEPHHKGHIDNRYNLLNNLLGTFDMVTSRGLYLTQQHDFRKTDFKRVSDNLIPLYDHRMMTIDADESARLSLHLLYRLGTLSLRKEAIHIDLSGIEREISDPEKFMTRALKASLKKGVDDPLFSSPYPAPTHEEIRTLLDILNDHDGIDAVRFKMIFCAMRTEKYPSSLRVADDKRDHPALRFVIALRYALLFGLVSIDEGVFRHTAAKKEYQPSAYINPDFTILIPAREMPKDLLYRVLSCTDLVRNDVVLQCRISKDSVLSAHKRKMHPDRIITDLEKFLKNGVPQNMIFMIREWISQSLEVFVKEVLLIKVNHPSFIDDLVAGTVKDSVIERISPNHAIIRREMLDDIVRAATKHNAIISLFTD